MRTILLVLLFVSLTYSCQKKEVDEIPNPKPVLETDLPKLYIYTHNNAPISKQNYTQARFDYHPHSSADGHGFANLSGLVKGRGNSTWDMPKKPYKIKFDSKQSFFNQPSEKRWVLLANYADKTLVRNYIAYWLAEQMDVPFPVSYHFVEVFLNGVHQGNYLLSDQVEVTSSRVQIESLATTENQPEKITGGYLLEIDQRAPSKHRPFFNSQYSTIKIRYPEQPSPAQINYIKSYINDAEQALQSDDFMDAESGFRKYFDTPSMARWFIISELFKNVDSKNFSSIFFFKPRHGKLTMGPIWDFDLSAGNGAHCEDCMQTEGWFIAHSPWFSPMYKDPDFKAEVQQIWNQYKPKIDQLPQMIDHALSQIEKSQKINFQLWPRFSHPDWTVAPGHSTHEAHVQHLKDFLEQRTLWMDDAINQ